MQFERGKVGFIKFTGNITYCSRVILMENEKTPGKSEFKAGPRQRNIFYGAELLQLGQEGRKGRGGRSALGTGRKNLSMALSALGKFEKSFP